MAEEKFEFSSVFIELDALLDTRISVLMSLGDSALSSAIDGGYHTRPADIFPKVDNEQFKLRYAERDKSVLASAVVTPMAIMLKEFCLETLRNIINTPFHRQPKVIVNVYPYKLEEDEINTIISAIKAITEDMADIEAVYMPYEEITPLYVKRDLSVMVMYDYAKWLEAHSVSGAFKRTTCPEVVLFAPAIYFKPVARYPSADENPFEAVEQLAAPLISLKLIPIEKFSMVVKATKKT